MALGVITKLFKKTFIYILYPNININIILINISYLQEAFNLDNKIIQLYKVIEPN
jgi:hypothetical protein